MKRKHGSPFGGKRIVDKVLKVLRNMPADTREAVGRSVMAELHGSYGAAGPSSPDTADEDERDLASSAMGMKAIQLAVSLVDGTPGMGALCEAIDASEDEYMPGGPPMSPVHDSLWIGWAYLDLRTGRHRESAADIACGVLPAFGVGSSVTKLVSNAMQSRLGIYEIVESLDRKVGAGARFRLREVVTRREIVIQLLQEYEPISVLNSLLVRALPATDSQRRARSVTHLAFGTPYVIENTNLLEWVEYFEREAARVSKSSLTPEIYEAIMRGAGDPTRWLEYVTVGYAGEDMFNVVRVRGIPDRPETLPHHREFDARLAETIPPRASAKERSQILSKRLSSRYGKLMAHASVAVKRRLAQMESAIVERGGDFDIWAPFIMPLCLYKYAPGGPPFSTFAEREVTLDDDLREWIDAGHNARVSTYEVVDVVAGERMTLRDIFDGEEVVVEERSASVNMPTRSLLLAAPVPYRGIWILEGMYGRPLSPSARSSLMRGFSEMRAVDGRGLNLSRLQEIIITWQEAENAAIAQQMRELANGLSTTTGERMQPTCTVFAFGENRREDILHAITRLRGCDWVDSPTEPSNPDHVDEFVVVTRAQVLEAQLALGPQTLEIKTLAPERTSKVVSRIRSKLGAPLPKISEQVEDLSTVRAAREVVPRESVPPSQEELAVVRQFFRRHYATFLDEPLPALDGKSPRQAAGIAALRGRLDELLRQHEFGVSKQLGGDVVDFAAMRRELGIGK